MDSIMNFKTLHFLVKVECDLLCTCFSLYSELTARFRKPNANWKEPEKIQLFFFSPHIMKRRYVNIYSHISQAKKYINISSHTNQPRLPLQGTQN